MTALKVLVVISMIFFISCAGRELTPATEIVFEGELIGNEEFTYASAQKVFELCMQAKLCMGLADETIPLPKIRGMRGGNAVDCGGKLKLGCYTSDGYITVPEGGDIEVISHECVHHWLYQTTGDLDPKHKSTFFLTCSGGLNLIEETQ